MWNAFVQRRNGGGYDERSPLQLIELGDDDCTLLLRAGLKIQKGASPRDFYCFQNLPSYYDGTPLQVLRLLEEMRSINQKVRRADAMATASHHEPKTKRQRLLGDHTGNAPSGLLPSWARSMDMGDEFLESNGGDGDKSGQLRMLDVLKVTQSSAKRSPSPVKGRGGATMYETLASPLKPPQSAKNGGRRSRRASMKIDVVSVQEELSSTTSSHKRKSESSPGPTTTSPLAALFSPKSIRTPSPGLKTRRSSVLQQFETPEQQHTGSETPSTVPAPLKRFSQTTTQYTVTTTTASDVDDDNDLSDGLMDDAPEDVERGCCDMKSVVEPLLDAWQRTSSRFQHAWEEVRCLSSSLLLVPLSDVDAEAAAPSIHLADVRDDAVDLLF